MSSVAVAEDFASGAALSMSENVILTLSPLTWEAVPAILRDS